MANAQSKTDVARPALFFVCGSPKSGTTWVQRILDAHPEVVCSGEGHFVERLVLPIRQVFAQYNKHHQLVAERVYQGKPYYHPLGQKLLDDTTRRLILAIMHQRPIPSGTRALGDKTPRYTQHLDVLARLFPGARLVHVIRDVRDVAVSRLHHAHRAGYDGVLRAGATEFYTHLENAAKAWARDVERARAFGSAHPDQYLELTYEGLHAEPAMQAARLFRHLGVRDDPEVVRSCLDAASFSTWSGREAGKEDKQSFFRKGVVGDWQNYLDEPGREILRRHCAALYRSLGYGEI